MSIRALTFRQPWAKLILDGKKTVEVRGWSPRQLGSVVVHAGKKIDVSDAKRLNVDQMDTGYFLGVVEIVDFFKYDEHRWKVDYDRHLTIGDLGSDEIYGWMLSRPRWFSEKFPGSGRLGFFDAPLEVVRELRRM